MTPEYDLVELARTGSRGAIESLIADVWPHAYRIALGVLHDRSLAEDAAQEACAVVYREISKLRSAGAFGVWFYRIVVRQTLSMRRSTAATLSESACGPAEFVETDRSIARLDVLRALARLTPPLRVVAVLHYYAGLNSREIAGVLRIADSSVRFRLMRARRRLERSLSENDAGAPQLREVTARAT